MTRIHVSMIVRNEMERHLVRAVECAVQIASRNDGHVIVTDDASTDATPDFMRGVTDHLQVHEEPMFLVHEGRARQSHYDFMSQFVHPGDWVLALDADETMNRVDLVGERVRDAIRTGCGLVLTPQVELWSEDPPMQRMDGYWNTMTAMRLYEFRTGGRITDKEMASWSVPDYALAQRRTGLKQNGLDLLHWGYSREPDRRIKYDRYINRSGHNPRFIRSILEPPVLREYSW